MIETSLIVAHDLNNVIGVDGKLPFGIPEDLQRFMRITMGGVIIMGRKTWQSIGSRPLPGRLNIVLSNSAINLSTFKREVVLATSVLDALNKATKNGNEKVFFIGGSRVYLEGYRYANKIYRTLVETKHGYTGNLVYFEQEINDSKWMLEEEEQCLGYKFQTFTRRK